jgi:hypothetical protein
MIKIGNILAELLNEDLKSKSDKGNRYFEMLKTKKFRHYDGNVLVDFTGGDEKRKDLVSKLSKEDKKNYKEWLKTDDGIASLKLWQGESINENLNVNTPNLGLLQTSDYLILIDTTSKKIIGVIAYEKVGQDLYHVPAIASEKGYGFMLYNIVMSLVSPNYIITDRDSSTTQAAVNVLRRMTQDPNIEFKHLDKSDKNYFFFKNESDEYNLLVNTKFRIKTPIDISKLIQNGKTFREKVNIDDDNLSTKAFNFFSKKLNAS